MKSDKIQRTNLFNGEFSPSGIEEAKCFRRFYYTKVLGLKPKTTPVALDFGTCIHAAVEEFYKLTSKLEAHPSKQDRVDVKIAVVQKFAEEWTDTGSDGDIKRNLETGVMIMSNYCDKYIDDTSKFALEDIETDQWVAMPNGTMLLCKMDRVLRDGNMIILVDTKTTSGAISPYFFRNFENHLPTSLYNYTINQLLGRCDYVMIDAIKVPPPPTTSKSEPFGRGTFMRTDLQIQDAVTTFCSVTDYIMSVLAKPEEEWATRMYCDQSHCGDYGGCKYLDICKHGLDHPTVTVNFDIVPPKR